MGTHAPPGAISAILLLFPRRSRSVADRTVPALAHVKEDISVEGVLRVGDGAVLEGRVTAGRGVVLGRRVRVGGPVESGGFLRVGRMSVLESGFHAEGPASFAEGARVAPSPSPAPANAPVEKRLVLSGVHVDVPTGHADALLAALRAVGWRAEDTGRTVSTDDDEESLTTLTLDVLLPTRAAAPAAASGGRPAPERDQPPAPGAPLPLPPRRAPGLLRGVLYADGDLHVGEGVETDLTISASGRVVVGRRAVVGGLVRAGGDVTLEDGAAVGDALCGGALHLGEGASVANLVEAPGGLTGPGADAWRARAGPDAPDERSARRRAARAEG